ncbi:MAG: hypothetical protein CVU39_13695 [Chloroflexi bacterium HGW-Chloroflexi-10]|nr:MAG: hypothetical protein CVU39_13695 [Chloroflexi bacterium HGW-Chloroflexi-10]
MKKSSSFLVLFVLLTILLSACQNKTVKLPADVQAGDIFLQECTYKIEGKKQPAQCGTLLVPENRTLSNSRLIPLPVIVVPPTNADLNNIPIFWLEGGPGQSNLKFNIPGWMHENFPVVMVGYRGMDGETQMQCPELSKALGQDQLPAHSSEAINLSRKALTDCATRLTNAGFDLSAYNIAETIQDMENARTTLGYDQINLFSISYGTRLAQFYSQNFPTVIAHNLMVSVNPPGHFVWNPQQIDNQLAYYNQLCQADPYCANQTSDLTQSIRSVFENMPQRWLFFHIDPDKVKMGLFALLFQRDTAVVGFDAILRAEQGDESGLFLLSMAADQMIPNLGTWGHFYAMGSTDYTPNYDYFNQLNPPDSIIGSPLSIQIWAPSDGWTIFPVDKKYTQLQPSDVETLMISGNVDFSTPAENATNELLPFLTNGHQVVLKELGHAGDVINTQPEAFKQLAFGFYQNGSIDDSAFQYVPMQFKPKFSLTSIARILIALPFILILLAGLIIWLVIHRKANQKMLKAVQ